MNSDSRPGPTVADRIRFPRQTLAFDGSPSERGRRAPHRLTYMGIAVAGFLTVRLLGLIAVGLSRNRDGRSLTDLLSHYDGQFYLDIAQRGYDIGPVGAAGQSSLAFHPLLPGIMAAGSHLGISATTAGLEVAVLSGIAAAAAIFRLGEALYGPKAGIMLAVSWAMLPHAIVQSMVYTESLFTAFAAFTLLALVRRNWAAAGIACVLAGLTRPTSVALIGTAGLVAVVAILRRQDGFRPWLTLLPAPLGLLGYWLWVGDRVGRIDGWFWLQNVGWHTHFDLGRETAGQVVVGLSEPTQPGFLVVALVVIVFGVLTSLLIMHRQAPFPVALYSAALFVVVCGSAGSFHSKGRLLLPEFTALIPIVLAFLTAKRSTVVIISSAMLVCSMLYGSYLLTVWPLSP